MQYKEKEWRKMLKKRHYLKLHKWSGELVNEVVSWNKFSDENKEFWLNQYKADFAIEEERISLT